MQFVSSLEHNTKTEPAVKLTDGWSSTKATVESSYY